MNCDRIAPLYEWFENAAFGGRLQAHRVAYLDAASGKQRALVLGDGDGRFTEALAARYPAMPIDSIEMSAGMVAQAGKRLSSNSQVRVIQDDVFRVDLAVASYDVVFSHFFLDCFEIDLVNRLIQQVSESLVPGGVWVISDFRQGRTGWKRFYTGAWLRTMYMFFRLVTGLKTSRLPEYRDRLSIAGFSMSREWVSMGGLIASELWRH